MSTIEKAAAKLAAKKGEAKAAKAHQAKPAQPAPEREPQQMAPGLNQPTPAAAGGPAVHLPSSVRSPVAATQGGRRDIAALLPDQPRQRVELDFDTLAARGFLTPNNPRSGLAQEFRKIKRRVLNRIDQLESGAEPDASDQERPAELQPAPFNTFMVTSALAGEGKTFVSINLAVSLAAEVDREVLLVDGDIAKADLSRNLGLDDRIGLGQVLKDPQVLDQAVYATNIPRLSIIPAGAYPETLDELLASDLMEELVRTLGEQNRERVIVFDAPPLLVTTEAAVLSRHLRQVLMVVEANRTPKDAVTQAVSELGDHRNVMLMLNKATGSGRYGYGYSYGYDSGDDAADTQDMPAAAQRQAE